MDSLTQVPKNIATLPTRLLALDERAFRDCADYFAPLFRALFMRSGMSQVDAEDLAASCISDLVLRIKNYRPIAGKTFQAWAFKIARNASADWWQNALKKRQGTKEWQILITQPATKSLPRAGVVAAVRDAIAELSESQRAIVFERDLSGEEKSYAEIAESLHITETAARVRHKRAIEKLKLRLKKDPRIEALLNISGVYVDKKVAAS